MLYFYGPPFLRKEVKTLNRHNGQYNITFWKGREVRNFDQILLLLSAFYLINSHCTFSRGFCSPSNCTVSYCKYMQSNTLDLDIPRGRQVFNCRQQLISFCPLMMMIFKILTIQIQHRKSSDILLIPLFASNAGQLPPYLNPQSSSAKKRDNVPSQASQFPLTVSYNWYCLGRQKKREKMNDGWVEDCCIPDFAILFPRSTLTKGTRMPQHTLEADSRHPGCAPVQNIYSSLITSESLVHIACLCRFVYEEEDRLVKIPILLQ